MRELIGKIVLVAVLATVGIGASAFAATFSEPTASPPGNNAEIPINIGSADQTKTGGFWADRFGATTRYALGNTSAWFTDSATSKTTVVAQQYCIGTDPTKASGNSCTTTFTGGGGDCHLERSLVASIPSSKYGYQVPYNDYCQTALSDSSFPLKSSDGWTATGSDNCAEYGGDGDNCNGSHKAGPLQCSYVRLVCDGHGVGVVTS